MQFSPLNEIVFQNQTQSPLIPSHIHSDFVRELRSIVMLAKLQQYSVSCHSSSANLYEISFRQEEKINYSIVMSTIGSVVSVLYVFTFCGKLLIDTLPQSVNVNDYRTMVNSKEPQGMLNCLKFFGTMI